MIFYRKQQWFQVSQRLQFRWGLAIVSLLLVVFIRFPSGATEEIAGSRRVLAAATPAGFPPAVLPTPQTHPLPPTLAQWQDANYSGDYFSQVRPTEVGYLVWSRFPVQVYIEQPATASGSSQAQKWAMAVLQAVQDWQVYLPLVVVEQPEAADINIRRLAPPLRASPTGKIPRARSAETRYELYVSQTPTTAGVLSHRCQIWLSPNQTSDYIQAAARHELGHALGIWGHSPIPTDVLYFSQVRNPPLISARDINTLKRVYEQPTRLGWHLKAGEQER